MFTTISTVIGNIVIGCVGGLGLVAVMEKVEIKCNEIGEKIREKKEAKKAK